MGERPQDRVEQERTVFAHSQLYMAAEQALKDGQERGFPSDFMTSLILSAFCLEAYLNFAGERMLPNWNEIERSSVAKKFELICGLLGIKIEWERQPHQSIKELWWFRNQMAHARTETAEENWKQPSGRPLKIRRLPKTVWEKRCTYKEAKKAIEVVEQMIKEIHTKAKSHKKYKAKFQVGALRLLHVGGGNIRSE